MELFRLTRIKYLENYTGRGGSFLNGARWNEPGIPVLYFASTPSVALLEMANYLPSPRLIPADYRLGIYHLPDTVSSQTLTLKQLPEDWSRYPYPLSTQKIGSQWLNEASRLILFVPSVAVAAGLENIAVVNLRHPEIDRLKLVSVESSLYNDRAFRGIDNNDSFLVIS
jgi:RES domain-containing protein